MENSKTFLFDTLLFEIFLILIIRFFFFNFDYFLH